MANVVTQAEVENMLRRLEESGPPPWIREMHEHFRQKGFYRPEDLRRVLGDPTDRLELRPDGPCLIPSQKTDEK